MKDFSSSLVALIAAVSVFWLGLYQFGKEKKLERNARKEEYERSIKISLFSEVTTLVSQCSDEISDVLTQCLTKKTSGIKFTSEEKINFVYRLQTMILALVSKVESHEVIAPDLFRVFRYALLCEAHRLMKLSDDYESLTPGKLWETSENLQPYISDLQVGLQNLAFADIFGEKVSYRKPISERYKVIENKKDILINLEQYFLNDTEWGKENNRIERDVFEK